MPISYYVVLSFFLFSIGMIGMLIRRNAIIVLMCIELMLNSVNLLMVAFSKLYGDSGVNAQLFVFFTMIVAAAEAAIGLAIIVRLYKVTGTIDISFLNKLKN